MSRGPGIAGEILARYRTSISKGLLPHKVLQVLASAGVVIQPYHFYREQAAPRPPHLRDSGSAGPEFAEAGPGDAVAIAALDPKTDGRAQIANDFSKGRRCFVLRMEGEIIAATWCDTAELDFNPCRRPLGDD